MPSHPYALPVEVIERIISFSFDPAGLSNPAPPSPSTSLLLVSKAVRLLALPYFFKVVTIRRRQDWQTFFDPTTGIFVAGEEGARRWSWVEELVVPLDFSPSVNRHYELGDPSYLVPLTIPDTRRLSCLRFTSASDQTGGEELDEGQSDLVVRFQRGLDPEILQQAEDETRRAYDEDGGEEISDEEDWSGEIDIDEGDPDKYISRVRQQYGSQEGYIQSREGQDDVEQEVEDILEDVITRLKHDFQRYTLPTRLKPLTTFVPDYANAFLNLSYPDHDPHPQLIFAPPSHRDQPDVSTNLIIVKTQSKANDRLYEDFGYKSLVLLREGFRINGPVILKDFNDQNLAMIKSMVEVLQIAKMHEWAWERDGKTRALEEHGSF